MTPNTAAQGISRASQPCYARKIAPKTLHTLESEFRAVCEAWSEAGATTGHEHGAKALGVLQQALRAPIRTPADAVIKMRMAMERSCWKVPGAEHVTFEILHQVAGYLEGLEYAE